MNNSRNDIVEAIMLFAKLFGLEKNYEMILSSYSDLPRIVEMIVYQMFLNDFNYIICSKDQVKAYDILYKYAKELNKNGKVKFSNVS